MNTTTYQHYSRYNYRLPRIAGLVTSKQRRLAIGGRSLSVAYPSVRDARWVQFFVLIALACLGLTFNSFGLSYLQLIVATVTCVFFETLFINQRKDPIPLPIDGAITGLTIGLLLRVAPGGPAIAITILACLLAMGSCQLLQRKGQPVFNPSLFALAAILVFTPEVSYLMPESWFGPPGVAIVTLILCLWWARKTRVLGVITMFLGIEALLAMIMQDGLIFTGFISEMIRLNLVPPTLLLFALLAADWRIVPKDRAGKIAYVLAIVILSEIFFLAEVGQRSLFIALFLVNAVPAVLIGTSQVIDDLGLKRRSQHRIYYQQ